MKEGRFLARIKSYGVGKPKANDKRPPVFVEFELDDPSGERGTIYWWGNMGDKSNPLAKKHPYEVTIDSLLTLGLRGNDPYALAENAEGILDNTKSYQLVIEDHEYNGNRSFRVKYINDPSQGGVKEALSHQEAKALAGYNFAGVVAAAKKEKKIVDAPVTQNTNTDDIPF
jgi:hypothetical protein